MTISEITAATFRAVIFVFVAATAITDGINELQTRQTLRHALRAKKHECNRER